MRKSEKSILCKDLKFAIPPNKLEYADFMLLFELLFRYIKSNNLLIPQTKATIKSKILDITFSFCDFLLFLFSKKEMKVLNN